MNFAIESKQKHLKVARVVAHVWNTQEPYPKVCPLCREGFKEDESIILLLNNGLMFPNTVIHERCTRPDVDAELKAQWTEAQQYRHWFR